MLANVGFIHNMCPYILHQKYQWIIGLGFHFRKTFVYSKIGGVDQFRKKLLVIDREHLLGDSLRKIESVDDLMFGVNIRFLGEEGRGEGLIRDWLCSVMTDMVQVVDGDELNGRCARPFAQTQADQTRVFPQPGFMLQDSNLPGGFFRCFGRVVGLAIKHNIQLGFTFDAVLFHQLAGQPVDLEDIRDSSPDKYRWYNRIIDVYDSASIKREDLFFAVKFGSDVKDIEKGDKGVVTLEHKAEFVHHSLYLEFVDSIRDAVVEIGDGLDDVISYSSRKLFFKAFTLEDCDLLLRGLSKLNLDEWKSYTEYDYTPADPVVSWFWECVGEFSEEQRLELFNFWTATRWLPPGGFKELNPRPLIQLAYPTAEEDVDKRYPVAHTCIRSLAFPRYTSIEVMREMLRMVVYSSHTFGLR